MIAMIRPATPKDLHFIQSTWLRSYKHSSFFGNSVESSIFFEWHQKVINRILSRSTTLVAVDPEDPEFIYGYSVTEQQDIPVLHYIYVKQALRGHGVGRELLASLGDAFEYTQLNRGFIAWLRAHPKCEYNPYRI